MMTAAIFTMQQTQLFSFPLSKLDEMKKKCNKNYIKWIKTMLYNSLHRNKISCCQNMMVSESQTREIPQTSPIRPFCLGLWHLSIFFLCQNTFPLVHALSVLGKLLHNIEEPSSNVTSYQFFLSTPRDS